MLLSTSVQALLAEANIDLDTVAADWRDPVIEVLVRCENDQRFDLSGSEVAAINGCSLSRVEQLARSGELPSYTDGWRRRYLKNPIYFRKARAVANSHPLGEPAAKIARSGNFRSRKKPVRARTAAELEGLRKGRAKMAAEARARRERVTAGE